MCVKLYWDGWTPSAHSSPDESFESVYRQVPMHELGEQSQPLPLQAPYPLFMQKFVQAI